MIRPRKRLSWALALLITVGAGSLWLKACFGPDTSLVFTWERHPDLPLDRFAAGRLGVIQPFYARSYLVVAYRYLMGHPLSKTEQAEAVDLWQRRLNGAGFTMFDQEEAGPVPGVNYLETPSPEDERDDSGLSETWLAARKEFLGGPPPEIQKEDKHWDRMQWFQKIQKGAFRTALRILRVRSEKWGKRDPRLKAWIQAQDQVFSSSQEHPNIPKVLPDSADPLLRKDRAYQMAAAKFYAQRYDEAIQAFEVISQDSESPWVGLAGYMIARCWYRQGEALIASGVSHQRESQRAFERALQAANQAAAYPKAYTLAMELHWHLKQVRAQAASKDPEFDQAARYLAKAAAAQAHPVERTKELAEILCRTDGTKDFGVDLGDYTILLNRAIEHEDDWDYFHHGESPWMKAPEKPRSIPDAYLRDDLTDWVFHVRETGPKAYKYAYRRWKEQGSIPWLLCALANAEPASNGVEELVKAVPALPRNHPGYPMAAYHQGRLLVASDQIEAARPVLDQLISLGSDTLSPSALNLVKSAALPLSRNREELLQNLLREVVGIDYPTGEDQDLFERTDKHDLRLTAQWSVGMEHMEARSFLKSYGVRPAFLEADGATVLNLELPTSVVVELANLPTTPIQLKREWLRCAWVRSVLLGDLQTAGQLAPEVMRIEPELEKAMAAFLAVPEKDRAREANWILLHFPGLRWYVLQSLSARTYQPTRKPKDYDWMHGYRLQDRHPFRDSFWPRLKDLQSQSWSGFWHGSGSPFVYESALRRDMAGRRIGPPGFLTSEERATLKRERDGLEDLEDGPSWLCRRVLAWAEESPDDPRVPEALHMAVRATRIGGATELSKKCFRLLHKRYPKTPWATKTPFYF